MPASIKRLFPEVPENRWNGEKIGQEGDLDERTLKSFHAIDAVCTFMINLESVSVRAVSHWWGSSPAL